MDQQQIIKRLTDREFDGNLWEKYGKARIYFNGAAIAEYGGLEWSTYNTGNISNAAIDGQRISNSECRRILGELNYTKIWFDLDDGEFHIRGDRGQNQIDNRNAREMVAQFVADAQAAIA